MLGHTDGVKQAAVNYANAEVQVQWDEEQTSIPLLANELEKIGYKLLLGQTQEQQEESRDGELQDLRRRMLWSIALTLPVFIHGMFFESAVWYFKWMSMLLTAVILLYSGRHFFTNAIKRIKYRQTNMDALVALSTGIAFSVSAVNTLYPQLLEAYGISTHIYFESAAVIVSFVLLGKYFEERAKHRSGEAIRSLMQLQPAEVAVVKNGEEQRVPLEDLKPYDRVIVKAGERIPVDGKVVKGASFIDESTMTGESLPLEKSRGMNVFAGTLNQTGKLLLLAEKVGDRTQLARIIEVVRKAQGSKAPAQRKADRLAAVFVPLVIIAALFTVLLWTLIGGLQVLPQAINSAVAVLVIACPCALGLATPTALMVGMGKAAEQGILIKDAQQLEAFSSITDVVLDKTGTLTKGTPTVLQAHWFDQRPEMKALLAEIEDGSDHPLAKAIASHLAPNVGLNEGITGHETILGKGIKAVYCGNSYLVGNQPWIEEQLSLSEADQTVISKLPKAASLVFFASEQKLLAVLALGDQPKEKSREAVDALRNLNLEVHMLTGDNEGAANAIAGATGIKKVKASCMPADKAKYIQQLDSKNRKIAMVGDGINDTQAMVEADVSVAMGTGTDVAMETAGITLLRGNLEDLAKAFRISIFTRGAINQNLFWAFAYNVVCIPIAAGILYPATGFLLSPMVASAAMAFSSLSVVLNSLRLRNKKLY